jgi:hypothetical protein
LRFIILVEIIFSFVFSAKFWYAINSFFEVPFYEHKNAGCFSPKGLIFITAGQRPAANKRS